MCRNEQLMQGVHAEPNLQTCYNVTKQHTGNYKWQLYKTIFMLHTTVKMSVNS